MTAPTVSAMRSARAVIVLGAVAFGAWPAAAQVPAMQAIPPGDTVLVNQPLRGTADSVRMHLVKGGQYRVLLRPAAATMVAISVDGRDTAFAPRTREGNGTVPTLIELYAPKSADYVILVSTTTSTVADPRIQVWSDLKLATVRQEQRDRAWGIGLSVAGELYSPYSTIDGYPEEGGTGIGGCLLLGSSGPVSGCLGFDSQSRSGEAGSLTWYFIEPRFRFLTAHALGHPFDLLLTLRFGQGHQDRLSVDPSLLAPGVMLAYHLDDRPGARGWRLTLQAYGAMLGNTDLAQKPTFFAAALGLSWIP